MYSPHLADLFPIHIGRLGHSIAGRTLALHVVLLGFDQAL